jgi:HPt (histidine-containing phosphotransfer) domain-containing protein
MRKYYLIGSMLTMLHLTAMAQTEQQLENAIRVYQTILESSPKPEADPASLLKLADNAEQLFNHMDCFKME